MIYDYNMYKLIVSDLDETLLTTDKNISKTDIDTITNLKDCKFVIATGRGSNAIEKELKLLNQYQKENEYIISFNGGLVLESKDNKIVYANKMPFEDVKQLFNIGLKYDVCIELCAFERNYCFNVSEDELEQLIKGGFKYEICDSHDIEFLKNKNIAKILFCKKDMEYLRKIKEEINLDDKFSISFSSFRYLELNPLGIDKGLGLQKLCEYLNIDIKDTIAVGDNLNDLLMIQKAGLGVGVKNSIKDIIPYCDIILESTNNENPITEIVNKYIKNAED